MFNKNKISLLPDEKIIYKAEKGLHELLQILIILILLFCVFTLIYNFIPGTKYPIIYSHCLSALILTIITIRVYVLYKAQITDLWFTDKRIISVRHSESEEIAYKDVYNIEISKNKIKIYLFNGKVYVFSNYRYKRTILEVISTYCPDLSNKK